MRGLATAGALCCAFAVGCQDDALAPPALRDTATPTNPARPDARAPTDAPPDASANTSSSQPQPAGDAGRGEAIYGRCLACHSLEADRTGPRHCGLIGRRAGSVTGFNYTDAMKSSGIVWDRASLDRFLTAPGVMVPGTAMTWAGIPDATERADLIAWLSQQNAGSACACVR